MHKNMVLYCLEQTQDCMFVVNDNHRRKSRGGHGGHVPRENWTAGDGVALCPPQI